VEVSDTGRPALERVELRIEGVLSQVGETLRDSAAFLDRGDYSRYEGCRFHV